MKGLSLLIGSFLLLSSHLFGIEESRFAPGYLSDHCPSASNEKITPALFPTSSPAIIPDSPRVFGEQTGSDHSNKTKGSFVDVRNFYFHKSLPVTARDWTSHPTPQQ